MLHTWLILFAIFFIWFIIIPFFVFLLYVYLKRQADETEETTNLERAV